jgi:hypothetical protein
MDNLGKIADGLSEMETPLLQARSLAMAVRMMAATHELPKDAGAALDAVADLMFERLISLCEERERLWRLVVKTPGSAENN